MSIGYTEVSILLPVHNGGDTILNAIESILSQTYTNWHCYIIDDGSTDNTSSLIAPYGSDSRFTILTNNKNKGICYSLNRGLFHSNSKYIARLDADDMWSSIHLELTVGYLSRNPHIDIVGTPACVTLDEYKSLPTTVPSDVLGNKDSMTLYRNIVNRNIFNHPSVVFKREPVISLGGYVEGHDGFEDWELWYKLLTPTNGMFLSVSTLYYYTGAKTKPPKQNSISYGKEFMKFKSMLKRQKR